jgi:hypothetical protein
MSQGVQIIRNDADATHYCWFPINGSGHYLMKGLWISDKKKLVSLVWRLREAMVARVTPNQKAVCSHHIGAT